MKSRASSHFLILILIVFLTAISHYAVYYGALIRGYETSFTTAGRNLGLLLVLAALPIILARVFKYQGNWTLYTSAVLLFSIGLTVQYRLFSDPEYVQKDKKAEARQAKIKTAQMHYIQENYSPEKKQMMGLPPTPPEPVDLSKETPRPVNDTLFGVLFSGRTLIPLFGIFCLVGVIWLMRRDNILKLLENNGFLLVLLTLVPLMLAAITSRAGKSIGNMTPWEPAKIPFLIGFAAILAILYKNLARTYWGIPRAKDVLPLVVMAMMPFVPFFVLKDFGQMMVFSSVYITLFVIAVRRLSQRFVLVGSVVLLVGILVVGALPEKHRGKFRCCRRSPNPSKRFCPTAFNSGFICGSTVLIRRLPKLPGGKTTTTIITKIWSKKTRICRSFWRKTRIFKNQSMLTLGLMF